MYVELRRDEKAGEVAAVSCTPALERKPLRAKLDPISLITCIAVCTRNPLLKVLLFEAAVRYRRPQPVSRVVFNALTSLYLCGHRSRTKLEEDGKNAPHFHAFWLDSVQRCPVCVVYPRVCLPKNELDSQGNIARKDRLVTVAMSARAEAQAAYQEMKQSNADLERRFRETQVHRMPSSVSALGTSAVA